MIYVAPTEPPSLKAIGKVSSIPERVGADILFFARGQKHAIQRKELRDLLASIADGRLAKELSQMRTSVAGHRLLIVEGKTQWSIDGKLLGTFGQDWTLRQWLGMLWSVHEAGCDVMQTQNLEQTIQAVGWFVEWAGKDHRSLKQRPGLGKGMWGTNASDPEWVQWMLQSVPGISSVLAERIYAKIGNPLTLNVTREQLLEVDGLGKKKVDALWRLFGGTST